MDEYLEGLEQSLRKHDPDETNEMLRSMRENGFEMGRLYSRLSNDGLEAAFQLRDQLLLHPSEKADVIWKYLHQKTFATNTIPDQKYLEELIHIFQVEGVSPVESIVVELVKRRLLSEQQVIHLQNKCDSKEIQKRTYMYQMQNKLLADQELSEQEVKRLLELRAFQLLRSALKKTLVKREALSVFVPPSAGEKDRKHREELYRLAQEM